MAEFIAGLTGEGGITVASVWAQITPIAAFIATLVLIKLGYNQLKRTTNNATRPNSKKAM
jgi:hypothetical protein